MIINIYLNDFSAGVLMSYTHIKINVWNNANFLQFLTTVSTLHCKLSFNLSKIPLISLGWSKYSCVANFTLSFNTAWFIKVHTATRWTIRHSLMLHWFADLMNVTEEVTIHRPNVSTLLSSAFIRGDLNAATRGPFIWSLISGLFFSDEV